MSHRRTTTAWVLGASIAAVATPLMLTVYYGVAIYALVAAVLVLRGPRAAFGGALLLVTGLWFAYWHFAMIDRCRSANGSCQVIDANGTAIPALTFVLVGAVLSVYSLAAGNRSPRGGA